MSTRLNQKDQALLKAVDEVLHYIWDPIGIADTPQSRDEYQGYTGHVFTMLHSGASESELSNHLQTISETRTGMGKSQDKSNQAAAALIAWRDFVNENYI